MREIRSYIASEPGDRYYRINNLIEQFAKADILSNWQIKINENFAGKIGRAHV